MGKSDAAALAFVVILILLVLAAFFHGLLDAILRMASKMWTGA
jgi:hypothetical protein